MKNVDEIIDGFMNLTDEELAKAFDFICPDLSGCNVIKSKAKGMRELLKNCGLIKKHLAAINYMLGKLPVENKQINERLVPDTFKNITNIVDRECRG
jgi:hypothetical protein